MVNLMIITTFLVLIINGIWMIQINNTFTDTSAYLREDYVKSQMDRIVDEVERVMNYINIKRQQAEDVNFTVAGNYSIYGVDLEKILDSIGKNIFLTIDVDVFDWSVIRSTGTPEPGGFLWDEALNFLSLIFKKKNVVGFDIVELAANGKEMNSSFAAAKLVYKLIGFKFFK